MKLEENNRSGISTMGINFGENSSCKDSSERLSVEYAKLDLDELAKKDVELEKDDVEELATDDHVIEEFDPALDSPGR